MNKEEVEFKQHKSEIKSGPHVTISTTLLFALITIFTFIVTVNPELLKNELLLSFQLCLSVTVFLYVSVSRARVALYYDSKINELGTVLYSIGIGFFINIIGILIFNVVSPLVSITYFVATLVIFVYYSYLVTLSRRVSYTDYWKYKKELITLIIILFLGLFRVLGFY